MSVSHINVDESPITSMHRDSHSYRGCAGKYEGKKESKIAFSSNLGHVRWRFLQVDREIIKSIRGTNSKSIICKNI